MIYPNTIMNLESKSKAELIKEGSDEKVVGNGIKLNLCSKNRDCHDRAE